MANSKKQSATIVGLEVHDFQGIRVAKLEHVPAKGLVRVTGSNGAGKSSLLKAISGALGGAAEVHERAIRDGAEDGATVNVELSNGYRVRRRHTEANPKGTLVVMGPDGGKHAQAKLNEMLGPHSFDPLAFFLLRPERQREILLSLGSDPELASKLDESRAKRQALYVERTPWIAQQRRARQAQKPDGKRPRPIGTAAEMAKLRELQIQDRERNDAMTEASDAGDDLADAKAAVEECDRNIADLEAELDGLRGQRVKLVAAVEEADRVAAAADEAAQAFPAVADEIQACMDRISQAEAVQAALRPWETFDAAVRDLAEATAQVDELTGAMGELEAEEHRLVAEAGIPVPDVSFDPNGSPLLKGRPLELASGGERIELSVNVALAADSEVHVCLLDEANDLDLEAIERLSELAEERDFQIWLCRIGLEGPGEVAVAGGEAVRAPEPALEF